MLSKESALSVPWLPLAPSTQERDRALQLSIARTAYNYVRSYPHLDAVPLTADIPAGEGFSADYGLILARVLAQLSDNFVQALRVILEREFGKESPGPDIEAIADAFASLKLLSWCHPCRSHGILWKFVAELSTHLPSALKGGSDLVFDIETIMYGLESTLRQALAEGPTAFLKATLFHLLGVAKIAGKDRLLATSTEDFEDLIQTLPKPLMLALEPAPWMCGNEKPCEQDWFFGYLQVAGFNTTNLCGVTLDVGAKGGGVRLADLLEKLGITNPIFQAVLGNNLVTLESAARAGNLYVCDYAMLAPPIEGSEFHGLKRFVAAPIALFYWNTQPKAGYPPDGYGDQLRPGVLQPIAIQLGQKWDPEETPLFTPGDRAHANDKDGFKWQLAKLFVNASCATQHESVAHLGDCHLVMGTVIVATHRQLAEQHPIFKLLWPHMRFTLSINDGAMHNLVIPGGVVATNVGTAMSSTLALVNEARRAYRWDEQSPERNFTARGVAGDDLSFPFRDDTLLVWHAIKNFVSRYLALYYRKQGDLTADHELQAWVNELRSPLFGGFEGMDGLVWDERAKAWRIDDLAYLSQLIAQIIYTAGPKHAAVNYPQYPLGSYAPSVAASMYRAPPTKQQTLTNPKDCLPWYLPLDVALYAVSFEYLLSGVQYDRLGHYDSDPSSPYFEDDAVRDVVAMFQAELADIETVIRKRDRRRPLTYPYQLPSKIPNSISI